MECRPPIKYVSIEGDPRTKLKVQVNDSYADNPLVTGPRYQPQDIRCTWSSFLSKNTSGVLRKYKMQILHSFNFYLRFSIEL